MVNNKSHKKVAVPRRKRIILPIGLVLAVALTGGALAQWASLRPAAQKKSTSLGVDQQNAEATPTSLTPTIPSKEYIYMGGRLVATEETAEISPKSQSFTANGGTGVVNVIAPSGFTWTAASNDPWITVTSTTATTVNYTVAANPSNTSNRTGSITIAGNRFTVAQGVAFFDVQPSHPYYDDIGKLSARGVTLGYGNGNYGPNDPVTRGQMAAFIIRALGLFNPPTPAAQRFNDVPSPPVCNPPGCTPHPFHAFIEELAVRRITVGCTSTTYCPDQPVLHEQMAAFIIRALGESNPPETTMQRFNDVPSPPVCNPPECTPHPFRKFIDRMAALGIWTGCPTTSVDPAPPCSPCYCPASEVKRMHMARILVRAFNL